MTQLTAHRQVRVYSPRWTQEVVHAVEAVVRHSYGGPCSLPYVVLDAARILSVGAVRVGY